MELKYPQIAKSVPEIIDRVRYSPLASYLFKGPITDLTGIVCEGSRKLGGIEVFSNRGSGTQGNFYTEEDVGGIKLTISHSPIATIEGYLKIPPLFRATAEGTLYHLLIYAHQWARGEPVEELEGRANPDSETYIDSRLVQEALRGQICYLASKFPGEADTILRSSSPGNKRLQDFITKELKRIRDAA